MDKIKRCNSDLENLYGYRVKLYPTEEQKKILDRQIELYRFVYNWCLSLMEQNREITGGKPPAINDVMKYFAKIRNSEDHKWLKEIPINTCRHAIMSAYASYSIFWKKKARRPKMKTKKHSSKYFKVRGERVYFRDGTVGFEGLGRKQTIVCKDHNVRPGCKLCNCAIVFDGIDYWFTYSTEKYYPFVPNTTDEVIGIDVGLRTLATLSDGTSYNFPDTYKVQKRIKRAHKKINKDRHRRAVVAKEARTKLDEVPLTKNMEKHQQEFRKAHRKLSNIKKNYISHMTNDIVSRHPKAIVIEDIDGYDLIKKLKKHKLAYAYTTSGVGTMKRQLRYKCKRNGIQLVKAPRYYASTQICSNCGSRRKIGASKIYRCDCCGLVIDRDYNAAINLSRVPIPEYDL